MSTDWSSFGFNPEDGRTAPALNIQNLTEEEQGEFNTVSRICAAYHDLAQKESSLLKGIVEYGPRPIKGEEAHEGEFQRYYREQQIVAHAILKQRHGPFCPGGQA